MTSTHSPKSLKLWQAQKRLADLESKIASDRKRRESELHSALDLVRRHSDAIKLKAAPAIAPLKPAPPPDPAPPSSPRPVSRPKSPTPPALIGAPATYPRDLPESALLLLRALWSDLGYRDHSFVEMQMEISRELDRADFARFERELVCNELNGARTEVCLLREERGQLLSRLELNRQNIDQLMKTEERTYHTLVSERGLSSQRIDALVNQLNELRTLNEHSESKLKALEHEYQVERRRAKEKIEGLEAQIKMDEKSKIALTLYLRSLEERLNHSAEPSHMVHNSSAPNLGHLNSVERSCASIWEANSVNDEVLKLKLNQRKMVLEEERKLIEKENHLKTELNKLESKRLDLMSNTPAEDSQKDSLKGAQQASGEGGGAKKPDSKSSKQSGGGESGGGGEQEGNKKKSGGGGGDQKKADSGLKKSEGNQQQNKNNKLDEEKAKVIKERIMDLF